MRLRRTGKKVPFFDIHIGNPFFAHGKYWVRTDTAAASTLESTGNWNIACNFEADGTVRPKNAMIGSRLCEEVEEVEKIDDEQRSAVIEPIDDPAKLGKTYYEAHITLTGRDPEDVKKAVEMIGWKFSKIDGDPVMGPGVKCYATRHFHARHTQREMVLLLQAMARCLERMQCRVTRRKVELVIYDDRSSKVRCDGACPECHVDDLPDN